jgi:hypothetical protein
MITVRYLNKIKYGSETWTLHDTNKRRIEVIEMRSSGPIGGHRQKINERLEINKVVENCWTQSW